MLSSVTHHPSVLPFNQSFGRVQFFLSSDFLTEFMGEAPSTTPLFCHQSEIKAGLTALQATNALHHSSSLPVHQCSAPMLFTNALHHSSTLYCRAVHHVLLL